MIWGNCPEGNWFAHLKAYDVRATYFQLAKIASSFWNPAFSRGDFDKTQLKEIKRLFIATFTECRVKADNRTGISSYIIYQLDLHSLEAWKQEKNRSTNAKECRGCRPHSRWNIVIQNLNLHARDIQSYSWVDKTITSPGISVRLVRERWYHVCHKIQVKTGGKSCPHYK